MYDVCLYYIIIFIIYIGTYTCTFIIYISFRATYIGYIISSKYYHKNLTCGNHGINRQHY